MYIWSKCASCFGLTIVGAIRYTPTFQIFCREDTFDGISKGLLSSESCWSISTHFSWFCPPHSMLVFVVWFRLSSCYVCSILIYSAKISWTQLLLIERAELWPLLFGVILEGFTIVFLLDQTNWQINVLLPKVCQSAFLMCFRFDSLFIIG